MDQEPNSEVLRRGICRERRVVSGALAAPVASRACLPPRPPAASASCHPANGRLCSTDLQILNE